VTPIIKRLELAEAALLKNGFQCVDDVWVAPAIQQEGTALDERAAFEVWGDTEAAPWQVAPSLAERHGESYIRSTDAAAWAAWQARAALAPLPAQPKPPADAAPHGGVAKATDQQIAEWVERHDLERAFGGSTSDMRCAFEDAQTLRYTFKNPSNEPAAVQQGSERDVGPAP